MDIDVTLAVGVKVPAAELERVFGRVTVPRVQHEEPRFDPATGATGAPAVDVEEETRFVLDAVEHEALSDLAAAIAAKTGCGWCSWAGYDSGDFAFLFGPELPTDDGEAVVDGRFSCSGGAPFAVVAGMYEELVRVGVGLQALGLDVRASDARVAPVWSIS